MKPTGKEAIESQVFAEEWHQNFGAGYLMNTVTAKNKLEEVTVNVRGKIELFELKKLIKIADNWDFQLSIKREEAGMEIKFHKKTYSCTDLSDSLDYAVKAQLRDLKNELQKNE